MLSCRAVINDKTIVCSVREQMDKILQDTPGISFFLSSITGTNSHAQKKDEEYTSGIAYFISYVKTKDFNEETIFALFHDQDVDIEISKLKTRKSSKSASDNLLVQLKQVVKVSK